MAHLISPVFLIIAFLLAFPSALSLPSDKYNLEERRQTPVLPGIQVMSTSCDPTTIAKIEKGILHASYLAVAGANAASNFTEPPFSFFFPPNAEAASVLGTIFGKVVLAQRQQGPAIVVTCLDYADRCGDKGFGPRDVQYGYLDYSKPSNIPALVFCPQAQFALFNPPPCSTSMGSLFTLGWLMLQLMVQVAVATTPSLPGFVKPSLATRQSATDCYRMSFTNPTKPLSLKQASCIATFASWAWDLGLGMPPEYVGETCMEKLGALRMFSEQQYSQGVYDDSAGGGYFSVYR
ncbi:MAG: hypothetical protein M1827_000939 [Pycnora praestabilis]|nr:MAG: hypothetical protein M1827_000939 [Pycnora praestabilis]